MRSYNSTRLLSLYHFLCLVFFLTVMSAISPLRRNEEIYIYKDIFIYVIELEVFIESQSLVTFSGSNIRMRKHQPPLERDTRLDFLCCLFNKSLIFGRYTQKFYQKKKKKKKKKFSLALYLRKKKKKSLVPFFKLDGFLIFGFRY